MRDPGQQICRMGWGGFHGRRGFTLVEVVASVVVVGMAMVAVLQMYSLASRTSTANRDHVVANNLLLRKFEEVKARGFGADVSESGAKYTDDPSFSIYSFDVSQQGNYIGNPDLKKVDVTMTRTLPYGGSRQDSLSTLIANY